MPSTDLILMSVVETENPPPHLDGGVIGRKVEVMFVIYNRAVPGEGIYGMPFPTVSSCLRYFGQFPPKKPTNYEIRRILDGKLEETPI